MSVTFLVCPSRHGARRVLPGDPFIAVHGRLPHVALATLPQASDSREYHVGAAVKMSLPLTLGINRLRVVDTGCRSRSNATVTLGLRQVHTLSESDIPPRRSQPTRREPTASCTILLVLSVIASHRAGDVAAAESRPDRLGRIGAAIDGLN